MRFSVSTVWRSALSLTKLKPHKSSAVKKKNIFEEEKLILWLTFNPGLVLTGLNRITRPRDVCQKL